MPPASSRRPRAAASPGFDAITVQGALLAPEWLARVADREAPQQQESDYRVPKGLRIHDEIGRAFRIAQAHWADFAAGRARGADPRALAESFVVGMLRDALGFASLVGTGPVVRGDRVYPIGHAALEGRVPVVVAPAGAGVDALASAFADAGRRRSAFGLLQEFLNAEDDALWGLCTDGLRLRIARDNSSLTRPTWIEVDLERIFEEERYADFSAFWLIAHETRLGATGKRARECPLEAWRQAGRQEGTRARDLLRRGVEEALLALGTGFLAHPSNDALREALRSGALRDTEYFGQLLRLVYRIIFLLTVEERGLLHPEGTKEAARALYENGYSMRRLRDRSARRSAHDPYSDLWDATRIVFRGLAAGEPLLGLPALAGLFAPPRCADLDASRLDNRSLLQALWHLGWLRGGAGLQRVNWRDLGAEELGSVYESLLELVPRVSVEAQTFAFAGADESKGNARKTTGSYYTPDSLVQVLLDSALEPVVKDTLAAHPDAPVDALLGLTIVDPACGSGHFLLAAARRLAAHVARLQSSGTPSASEYRHAVRQVVSRCIYGVDLNPMAVELCKVALWMEAVEPGLPLTFLDARIRHGNALLGTTPELMERGIPNEAWGALEGDDRDVARALKKRNKEEAKGQTTMASLWAKPAGKELEEVRRAMEDLEAAPDDSLDSLLAKEGRWEALRSSPAWQHQKRVADAWCAAFVWPKPAQDAVARECAPTNALWRALRDGLGQPPAYTAAKLGELAEQYRFFHWPLEFPTVFARGGFDVVLGNPPWERVKLQEVEFFASRDPEIAGALNAAARKKMIAALPETNRVMWKEWQAALREADGQTRFIRDSRRYPLCGKGDVNTYALFAEHNRSVLRSGGRAGFIVPTGIATDDTTKDFFDCLTSQSQLRSLYDFQSGPGLFSDVGHARFKFCLLTIGDGRAPADLLFFARSVSELSDAERHFSLSPDELWAVNPNTHTCPTFRSRRDALINLGMYRRSGILVRDGGASANPWRIIFRTRLWHMAEDSAFFRTSRDLKSDGYQVSAFRRDHHGNEAMTPLIEAKMVHHFDHRYGDFADHPDESENTSLPEVPLHRLLDPTYVPTPRYWVPRGEVERRLESLWERGWMLGWRDVTNATNERTVIAAIVPRTAVGHKFPLLMPGLQPDLTAALCANLSSMALDYAARQKVGSASLAVFVLKQLPILHPETYSHPTPWFDPSTGDAPPTILSFLLPRVLELTYTAWDLQPFARDVGCDGPPFRWDPARRAVLRAELDAAFFHLYGVSRDDAAYILDTFPIVRRREPDQAGRILAAYDAMAEATRTGVPYRTPLAIPPADLRVTHDAPNPELPDFAWPELPPAPPALPTEHWWFLMVWALILAAGGRMARADVARAFALLAQPMLLARLAPPALISRVETWTSRVPTGTIPPGTVSRTLSALAERSGVRLTTDEAGAAVVEATLHTANEDDLDPWLRYEARLALAVLRRLDTQGVHEVEAAMAAEDRALLAIGGI
ncbi:N-6 DNA methylase [Myxococcota bacterium]|nr:N-6 DNA methylase [Myxococcota bacterium]